MDISLRVSRIRLCFSDAMRASIISRATSGGLLVRDWKRISVSLTP